MKNKKIVIIGAGNVGSHITAAGIHKDLKADFILVDISDKFENAQVLDLKDALVFSKNTKVKTGDLGDKEVTNADIFVITAGVPQKKGEDRIALLDKNVKVLQNIKNSLGKIKNSAIVVIVSNPVDLLTQKATEIFSLPKGRVFGTGTSLDSARLRWHLAELKDKKNKKIFPEKTEKIKAYVLGEHGDSSFVCWSQIKNSEKVSDSQKSSIEKKVRREAYEIIEGKGATYFGIGATVANILETILSNKKKIFSLSVPLSGQYGHKNIAIGVLAKLSKKGITKIIEKEFSKSEKEKFEKSVKKLKSFL